jgi:hypothetical protein
VTPAGWATQRSDPNPSSLSLATSPPTSPTRRIFLSAAVVGWWRFHYEEKKGTKINKEKEDLAGGWFVVLEGPQEQKQRPAFLDFLANSSAALTGYSTGNVRPTRGREFLTTTSAHIVIKNPQQTKSKSC